MDAEERNKFMDFVMLVGPTGAGRKEFVKSWNAYNNREVVNYSKDVDIIVEFGKEKSRFKTEHDIVIAGMDAIAESVDKAIFDKPIDEIDSKTFDMCGNLGMEISKKLFYLDNNYQYHLDNKI